MPDYSKSKIYKIVCNETGLCYIGSTCYDKISQRLAKHTSAYRVWIKDNSKPYCYSYIIFEKDNYHMELIELYPCSVIDELTTREGWYQRNTECVNRNIAGGRDHILYLEYHKKYYADNQVQQLAQRKQYYAKNKDQVAEYYKKYRDKNAVELAERNKKYYEQNKDILNQKKRDRRLAKKLLSQTNV